MASLMLQTLDDTNDDTGPDGARTIYNIPEANLAKFEREIAKLSKKSIRMIGLPITPIVFSHEIEDDGNGDGRKIYQVYLTADTPKIEGWTFVARLDHSQDTGNIIRSVPNTGVELPESYRTVAPNCDHCRVNRKRRDTFVIRNDETGTFQQVGSSCLEDFFGHDPYKIARLAEYLGYANEISRASEEDTGAGLNDHRYVNLEEFLGFAAKAVLKHGWVSAKAARESEDRYVDDVNRILISTRESAISYREKSRHDEAFVLTDEERALATAAIEWAQTLADNPKSDYEHNVAVIANSIYIEPRSRGLAASIVGVYYNNLRRNGGVQATQTGKLDGLVDLLAKATVKSPKIRMSFDEGKPLAMTLAKSGKNEGSVYLSDGGPFGANVYYGRVAPDGTFLPSNVVSPNAMTALTKVLEAMSSKPAETAAKFGHLTGRCCFCNQSLNDERSTEVGYGPVCAKTFNLPWGS